MTGSSDVNLPAIALAMVLEEPRPTDQQIANRLTSALPARSTAITPQQAHDLYQQGWDERAKQQRCE